MLPDAFREADSLAQDRMAGAVPWDIVLARGIPVATNNKVIMFSLKNIPFYYLTSAR